MKRTWNILRPFAMESTPVKIWKYLINSAQIFQYTCQNACFVEIFWQKISLNDLLLWDRTTMSAVLPIGVNF